MHCWQKKTDFGVRLQYQNACQENHHQHFHIRILFWFQTLQPKLLQIKRLVSESTSAEVPLTSPYTIRLQCRRCGTGSAHWARSDYPPLVQNRSARTIAVLFASLLRDHCALNSTVRTKTKTVEQNWTNRLSCFCHRYQCFFTSFISRLHPFPSLCFYTKESTLTLSEIFPVLPVSWAALKRSRPLNYWERPRPLLCQLEVKEMRSSAGDRMKCTPCLPAAHMRPLTSGLDTHTPQPTILTPDPCCTPGHMLEPPENRPDKNMMITTLILYYKAACKTRATKRFLKESFRPKKKIDLFTCPSAVTPVLIVTWSFRNNLNISSYPTAMLLYILWKP